MLLVLAISIVIGVTVGVFIGVGRNEGFTEPETYGAGLGAGFVALLLSVIAGAIAVPVLMGTGTGVSVTSVAHKHEVKLVSLKSASDTELHGSFFLGAGSVDGSSASNYTYMYGAKDDNGRTYYKLATVDTDDSRVYETVDETPNLVTTTTDRTFRNGWIAPFPIYSDQVESYAFTVPEGSIVQNYQPN